MKKLYFFIVPLLIFTHLAAMHRYQMIRMRDSLAATKEAVLEAQAKNIFVQLNMSYIGLEELPEDFFEGINNIVSLNLTQNKLLTLPPMKSLVWLSILNLEGNNFSVFPAPVCSLGALSVLNLSFNGLTEIPNEIANLHHLRVLNLMMNQLVRLPKTISLLGELEELYVSHNQLINLPDSIGALLNLQILTLSNNALQTFPDSFTNLTRLRSLNVANNQLDPDLAWLYLFPALQANGTKIIGLPKPVTADSGDSAASTDTDLALDLV